MGQASALRLRFDAFDLDEADARLKRDGKPVALPPKAFGEISIGDSITVTRADDSAPVSRVTGCRVVDPHLAESAPEADARNSAVDCSQLDRALADSLRLVIQATRAEPPAPPAPRPEQKL